MAVNFQKEETARTPLGIAKQPLMKKTYLLHNVYTPGAANSATRVFFNEENIIAVGEGAPDTADVSIDGQGLTVLPGVIDAHVHFREPGLTHKGDIASESKAARTGGVTTVFDMPNTVPQTTDIALWRQKMEIAAKTSAVNYAFFIGATNDNLSVLLQADFSRIPGVKVFLGSSTGNMLVNDNDVLSQIFDRVKAPIVVHAEDEDVIRESRRALVARYGEAVPVSEHTHLRPSGACVRATARALELLARHPAARLHIAHLSTAREVEIIAEAKRAGLNVTCEVSPTHLTFCDEDYERLGSRIKINPSVKSRQDREALRRAVRDGHIDIIATDHAPHTLADKEGTALTAASGAPMVQFSLPLMLDLFGPETVRRTMCENPARIFGVKRRGFLQPGYAPEMVLVEKDVKGYTVNDSEVLSKCGWTPLAGHTLHHRVVRTNLPCPGPATFER